MLSVQTFSIPFRECIWHSGGLNPDNLSTYKSHWLEYGFKCIEQMQELRKKHIFGRNFQLFFDKTHTQNFQGNQKLYRVIFCSVKKQKFCFRQKFWSKKISTGSIYIPVWVIHFCFLFIYGATVIWRSPNCWRVVFIFILQMGKEMHTEIKWFAQIHTDSDLIFTGVQHWFKESTLNLHQWKWGQCLAKSVE